MSAVINTKTKSMPTKYVRRAAELISGAASDYFKETIPTIHNSYSDIKSSAGELSSTLASTAQNVLPKLRQIKSQAGFRSISDWFLGAAAEYENDDEGDASLKFDTDTEEVESTESAQITDFSKGAKQISKAVIESSHQIAESQQLSTANITSAIDKQTAVIQSGFDRTVSAIEKVLEIVTKNTAAIIETNVVAASSREEDHNANMLSSGKFNLSDFRKMVGKNLAESEIGTAASIIGGLLESPEQLAEMLSSDSLIKGGLKMLFDKGAPKLKENLKVFDDALNETIMSSLLRLGEKRDSSTRGLIGRVLGINALRNDSINTSKAELSVKATPYDTISKETLTGAIPGYLRQLVLLAGGPDMVYDYRSRSFKTKKAINQEFNDSTAIRGGLRQASPDMRNAISNNSFNQMMYDLMLNDLGSNQYAGIHRDVIDSMRDNLEEAKKYARKLIGDSYGPDALKAADLYAEQLHKGLNSSGAASTRLGNQVSYSTHKRNVDANAYAEKANLYEVDISGVDTSVGADAAAIKRLYGLHDGNSAAIADKSGAYAEMGTSGISYTNKALYEIYNRLETGINVFQTGSSKKQKREKYARLGALDPPEGHKSKASSGSNSNTTSSIVSDALNSTVDDGPNLLRNNQLEDGKTEDLSKGARLSRWGSKRGGAVMKALFNGSPEQVRDAFGAAVGDLAGIVGDSMKDGAAKINDSFGNISGMLKHKIFGSEYSYQDGDETVHVKENKGIIGFIGDEFKSMFDKAKDGGSEWLKTVKGYFNYGDSDEDEGVVSSRKKILAASLGAFAGAGILGGPIGLLVGSIAGGAVGTSFIGKKLNKLLFGHNDEGENATGEPTGIISKAVDAVTSPIQFQLSKTLAVSGAALQKHIFGPMSDIGYALKDRMLNRVDSFFQPLKDGIKKVAGSVVGWVGKKAASIVTNVATAATRLQTTVVGKAARGAINMVTGAIGLGQIFTANRISSRSYHRLRNDETYPLQIGEKYYDPRLDHLGANDPSRVRKLTEDAVLPDGTPDEFIRNRIQVLEELPADRFGRHPRGIMLNANRGRNELRPSTKNFLKWRRRERNAEINKSLAGKGFKGGIGGFFGSEYKTWRKNKWKDGIARRERFNDATAEIRKTPEEIAAEKKQRDDINKISDNTERGAEAVENLNRLGSEAGSIYTHDQGIHDRLDTIIGYLTGNKYNDGNGASVDDEAIAKQKLKEEKESNARLAAEERKENFANSALATAGSIAATGGLDDEDEQTFNAIVNEAQKDNSNDSTISKKLGELLSGNKGDNEGEKEEKEESIFSKILNGILEHPMLAGIAAVVPLLLSVLNGMDIDGLKLVLDSAGNLIQWGANTFQAVWGAVKKLLGLEDSDQDATELGMNMSLAKYDVAVDKKTDIGALGTLKHVVKNGAGDYINNSTATTLKNDVTWLGDLRRDISTKAFAGLQSEHLLNRAATLDTQAAQLREQGGIINNWRANRKSKKAEELLNQGEALQEGAATTSPGANLLSNIGRSYARVGVIDAAGKGAGFVVSTGAKMLGASDEFAEVSGNVGNAVVSGGLTANLAKTAIHNGLHPNNTKTAIVDKIINGVTSMIKFLAEKVGADKAVAKIATSKPVETVASICSKVGSSLKTKIDDLVIKKLEAGLAKLGVDNALTVATAGLAIGAGAIAGGIDGWCKTNHLFGVLPGDETAGMRAISTAMGAALGAFSMTPLGWICIILDTIDAILTAIPVIGKGVTQIVAQLIYSMCGGGAELAEKQAAMEADRIHANETYGTNMNAATHNDEVNSSGFIDSIINGKSTVGDDGYVVRDEAGAVLKEGGAKNFMFGNERQYMHNDDGSVMRSEDGSAVVAKDKYGRTVKKNSKWGDSVGNILGNAGRFIFGGDTYETDENGIAKVDENGNYIKSEREKSIIGKAGDTFTAAADAAGAAINEGWNNLKEGGAALLNGAGDLLNSLNPFAKKKEEEVVKDSTGAEVKDSKGKKVKRGSIGTAASDIVSGLTGSIAGIINDVKKATDDTDEDSTVTDEKGKAVIAFDSNSKKIKRSEIGDFIKEGITKITSRITDPLKQMAEGVDEWEKKEAPWKNEKGSGKGVVSWISKTVGSFWDKIKSGVDGLSSGVSGTTSGALAGINLKKIGIGGPVANTILEGGSNLNSSIDINSITSGLNTATSRAMTGGNPLNKDFGISSGYGYRGSEFHSGVDLYPLDNSGSAEVGARFNGEILSAKDDIPDSHTGLKVTSNTAGNYVTYKTDEGLIIRNFHLKSGSIPNEMKKPGAKVRVGQKLGSMGSTGRSTGPHLHYQMESDNAPVDASGYGYRSIDPTDSVKGGSTLSTFTSNSSSDSFSSIFGNSESSTEEGTTNYSSIIEALSGIGNQALQMMFGGLISGDIAGAGSIISGTSGYEQFLNYTGDVKNVDDFLALCAKEIGTKDNGNNRVKYNDWFWGNGTEGSKYPWCMAFVQWCFNKAGLDLPIKTAGCGSMCDYYEKNDPSKIVSTPKPGDLIIFQFNGPHDHVGIVKAVNGTTYTTIEGNTSGTVNGSQWNGGVVAQKTRYKNQVYCFIRAIDFDALKIAVANRSTSAAGDGAEALWAYLRGLGYNDIAIAGILGCWKKESNLTAKRIEGDHLSSFPGYDALINSQTAMDNWTRNGLGKTESKNPGYFIGGHAYPGVGLAQWTKGRNKALMDFAKQHNGKWYDPAIQLAYFQEELKNNYYKKVRPEELNSTGSVEAATKQFCSIYEGYNGASGVSSRQTEARNLYSQYAGKFGIGGGTDDEEHARLSETEMRRLRDEIDSTQLNSHNSRVGIGGPKPKGRSEISQSSYSRKPRRPLTGIGGSVSEVTYPSSYRSPAKQTADATSAPLTVHSTDISQIVSLMNSMVSYLERITKNTGESNDLLEDIKDNDTSETTTQSSSLSRSRNSTNRLGAVRPTSSGNTRLISGMVRP